MRFVKPVAVKKQSPQMNQMARGIINQALGHNLVLIAKNKLYDKLPKNKINRIPHFKDKNSFGY